MNNGTINNFIDEQLRSIIKDIPSLFEPDELAYISLQQKNERQIRDKVAYRLQQNLDKEYGSGQYLVRCEWPSYFDVRKLDYSKSKEFGKEISWRTAVDMAILKMNETRNDYDEVIALIEFKAHSFLNYEKWPYEEFAEDVAKMYSMTGLNSKIQNADLYFIMLTNSIGSDGANLDKFGSAIVSQDIFALNQKKGNSQKKPMLYDEQNPEPFIKQLKDFWKGFTLLTFDFGDKNQIDTTKYSIQYNDPNVIRKTPEPVVKLSGKSFGYHIWQTGLVWGPYKASDLKVSAK